MPGMAALTQEKEEMEALMKEVAHHTMTEEEDPMRSETQEDVTPQAEVTQDM